MLKKLITFTIIGFSTVTSAKSILSQIKDDKLKVAIDYSAIINKQLVTEDICNTSYMPTKLNSSGTPVKMLGYATVYMGAGPGISRYGHLGERFVYCIGNELHDMYYDGIKLTKEAIPLFESDYPDARKDYINSNKVQNSLYYRKIQNPTQTAVYGADTIANNRNVYEQWLDITENEMYDLLVKNINRVANQSSVVLKEGKLAAFKSLFNNCTYEVTEDLRSVSSLNYVKVEIVTESFTSDSQTYTDVEYRNLGGYLDSIAPKTIYNALSAGKVTKLLVIYPSQDNVRKIFFTQNSFENSIAALEVPPFKLNPKFAVDWSEEEIDLLKTNLADYKSPLVQYFMSRIHQ